MSTPKEFLIVAQEVANEVDHEDHDEAILVAFDAVYLDIVSQAKAEALREAAGELSGVCADFAYMRADGLIEYATPEDWLLARAATIEGETK